MLNETLFPSLAHARATLAGWRTDYNVDRPHLGIGWKTPNEYAATFAPQRGLTLRTMTSSAPATVAQPAQLGKTETRILAQVGSNLGATSQAVACRPMDRQRAAALQSFPRHWARTNGASMAR